MEPGQRDTGQGHGFTVPDLLREVLVDFVGFAQRHLVHGSPPLMYVAMWLIGMDAVAGSIELEYYYSQEYLTNNWFHAWVRIMAGGVPAGVLRYWLVGSVFHLIVLAAGGKGSARTSRYIFLYAALPVAVCDLAVKILEMVIYGDRYFEGLTNAMLDGMFSTLMLAAYAYTVVLCYRGMRVLQGTEKRRSLVMLVAASLGMIFLMLSFLG
jgi:hypothetical protein